MVKKKFNKLVNYILLAKENDIKKKKTFLYELREIDTVNLIVY